MIMRLLRVPSPLVATLCLVTLSLAGLIVGYEPIGADPDNMYRPIKSELRRALVKGTLPFWSDLFGVGAPLVAESHVAAFYPPNWALYGTLGVSAAYRWSIILHYIALAAATYAYGRALALTQWGAALAALSFTLSGFQTSHVCHEPFYNLLPYLPLSLCFAERYLVDGRVGWLAGIALAIGTQITSGHFQIQFWTCCLVVLTGLWRALAKQSSRRRAIYLTLTIAWAAGVAAVQLGLTWELMRIGGFARPPMTLTFYSFPPSHWAQLAFPQLYMGFSEGSSWFYWKRYGTLAEEATLYVGTITLIFAFAGYFAEKDRPLAPWRWLIPIGFVLGTMSQWWLEGYLFVLKLPGFGLFRAPGRYTLLTTLGLCLVAGRGFDRALSEFRFKTGFRLAALFAASALIWSIYLSSNREFTGAIGENSRIAFLSSGTLTWVIALPVVWAWRQGKLVHGIPFLLVACELAYLFYHGPTPFARPIRFPEDSPAFRRLSEEKNVGLVAGWLRNNPIRMGFRSADWYLAITPPPPNYLLMGASHPNLVDYDYRSLMRRFGVTHGVIESTKNFLPGQILWLGEDPVLNEILPRQEDTPSKRIFRVERYDHAFPEAHAAVEVGVEKDWFGIFPRLTKSASLDKVWFLQYDEPPNPPGPRATAAEVMRWDGLSGEVKHNGTCDLVLRRAYYPGWTARINHGPKLPVTPADGGLQSIRLPGSGVSKVEVSYRPTGLIRYGTVSLSAILAAVVLLGFEARRKFLALL